jgi:hypothetical protein
MAEMKDKVQNALDEARMLMLGTEVLIGFDFRAVLEKGFDQLPPLTQYLKMTSLGLMLVTLGLLLWPGAFHQQVEQGEDTPRVHRFATRVMMLALLPFATGVGLDLLMPFEKVLGPLAGALAALGGAATALFFWYGLELLRRHPVVQERDEMDKSTPLQTKIKQVLTEARVVLPGAQALLGFQLIATLSEGFDKLPEVSKQLHLVSLGLLALSVVLLMTPAAYHRIVEHGENTEHFHRFAGRVVLSAMIPLALAIGLDFFIVLDKVTKSSMLAVSVTGLVLAFFFGCWFGYTSYARRNRERAATQDLRAASATGMPRML